MTETLEDIVAEATRQREEVDSFLQEIDPDAFGRRPTPDRWSVGEQIAHIALTDPPYFEVMRAALDEARRRGRMSDGPFRGRPLGNWFARKMEPPVKRRFKTMSALEPPKTLDPTTVRTDFSRCRDELIDLVRGGEGVDFDRATIRSPYLRLLRMPVSSACNVLLAHARRHIWLARRALATSGKTSD